MPVRNPRAVSTQNEDNTFDKKKSARKTTELVGSLMHIKARLEDYLRLVTITDPSDVQPPEDIKQMLAHQSSYESFGIMDNKTSPSMHTPPVP